MQDWKTRERHVFAMFGCRGITKSLECFRAALRRRMSVPGTVPSQVVKYFLQGHFQRTTIDNQTVLSRSYTRRFFRSDTSNDTSDDTSEFLVRGSSNRLLANWQKTCPKKSDGMCDLRAHCEHAHSVPFLWTRFLNLGDLG